MGFNFVIFLCVGAAQIKRVSIISALTVSDSRYRYGIVVFWTRLGGSLPEL
jgi:energy-converting hydrogenase Eha subunit H